MAHTFIEHIAKKVVPRIVLTNDPDFREIDIQRDVLMRVDVVE